VADTPFNPLDKRNLGESVASALLKQQVGPLPPPERFNGAGIYAIYYVGSSAVYKPVAERNRNDKYQLPIYVGKAVPPGARKGGFGLGTSPGSVLFNRLREHGQSIQAVRMELSDFRCRYLIAEDIWIPLGESLLIEMFMPLWNVVIEGFGNHAPGRGRQGQVQSPWDALHPGRNWAATLPKNLKTAGQIKKTISDFFAGREVPIIQPQTAVVEESE
jgi:hypothetical protein